MLCREGELSSEACELLERARSLGIDISIEPEREMRRMSAGNRASELIAFEGPDPHPSIDELMASKGLVLLLVGLRYPGNVGFILRSAEVAGAAGIVLDSSWAGSEFDEARRVGMRAHRFLPVVECAGAVAMTAARQAGRRVVALETTGKGTLWNTDLSMPILVVVGGETTGIPDDLLTTADEVIRIPTRGFIPSYNVQAAVGMVLGEWMRQSTFSND